jgi:hypothetical protein
MDIWITSTYYKQFCYEYVCVFMYVYFFGPCFQLFCGMCPNVDMVILLFFIFGGTAIVSSSVVLVFYCHPSGYEILPNCLIYISSKASDIDHLLNPVLIGLIE